jgi:hypothetical protein
VREVGGRGATDACGLLSLLGTSSDVIESSRVSSMSSQLDRWCVDVVTCLRVRCGDNARVSMANFKSPLVATKSPHPSSVIYFFLDEN